MWKGKIPSTQALDQPFAAKAGSGRQCRLAARCGRPAREVASSEAPISVKDVGLGFFHPLDSCSEVNFRLLASLPRTMSRITGVAPIGHSRNRA